MGVVTGFNFVVVKECLVFQGGFCLREGHEINFVFLHTGDYCFCFLWVVSCSSDVQVILLLISPILPKCELYGGKVWTSLQLVIWEWSASWACHTFFRKSMENNDHSQPNKDWLLCLYFYALFGSILYGSFLMGTLMCG